MPLASPAGVGIDLAEPDAFSHLESIAIQRAAARWLTPSERAWCSDQPSFRRALVTVLSCKESAYKAWGGAVPVHEVAVRLEDGEAAGEGDAAAPGQEPVALWWRSASGHILTVGVAGRPEVARGLAGRIIRERCGLEAC